MEMHITSHKDHPFSHTMHKGKVYKWCLQCSERFGDPITPNNQLDLEAEAERVAEDVKEEEAQDGTD